MSNISKENLKITAVTLQAIKNHLDSVQSRYNADERLEALFGWLIWTFGKLYDQEEELDTIFDNLEHIFTADDKSYMYDDLRYKKEREAEEKLQNKWREFMQKIIMLAKEYNWWNI